MIAPATVSNASGASYSVQVGYADTLRANPTAFPTPFAGDSTVIYAGCAPVSSCTFDGGAVRVINTGTSPLSLDSVVLKFDTCTYDMWPHSVSIPVGDSLVVAQTLSGAGNGCTPGTDLGPDTFDTSDIGPGGAGWAGNCAQSGLIPEVDVTTGAVTTPFSDTGQVLNTGGVDAASCSTPVVPASPGNESIPWSTIGNITPACAPDVLTLAPPTQTLPVNSNATVTANLSDQCGPIQGASIDFSVLSGPNSGSSGTGTTDANGNATFTYTSSISGTDTLQASDTTLAGNLYSNDVAVIWGQDLTVSKTAAASFTRTFNWSVTKSVDKTLVERIGGGTGTFNYTVNANETGYTDSNWQVTGTITVSNPNNWEPITANVTDAINNGGTCTVAGGTNVTIPASQSVTLNYTCTYTSAPSPASFINTATATWDATTASTPDGSATGTATGTFGPPTTIVNPKRMVTDTFNGSTIVLGTLTGTTTQPFTSATYTYSRTVKVPSTGCAKYTNTATMVGTGQSASQTVEVCGPAATGAHSMGFWRSTNGRAIISAGASTSGVCNSGTWLRQYAPFQDLSATATCSQVATYVGNVIKAAEAPGVSANAALKGQVLATALSVYFSDPSLGGNQIGAPAAIGAVTVDVTHVCGMTDSVSGTGTCPGALGSASTAFGGATSMTVLQMLSYAASQSNVGGSTWYANVSATEHRAKNAFDSINNLDAFSP